MKHTQEEAFGWIIDLLNEYQIPFQLSGGFAARVYGSSRELADIDIDLPQAYFNTLLPEIKPYITYGPERYHSDLWDLDLITLVYNDQEIDLAGCENARIFNTATKQWEPLITKVDRADHLEVFGRLVPVITKSDLIEYKRKLARDVDIQDIKALA